MSHNKQSEQIKSPLAYSIGIGTAIGVSCGVAMNNLPVGIALAVAIAAAFYSSLKKSKANKE